MKKYFRDYNIPIQGHGKLWKDYFFFVGSKKKMKCQF